MEAWGSTRLSDHSSAPYTRRSCCGSTWSALLRMHLCVCTCVDVSASAGGRVCVCACARTCVRACVRACKGDDCMVTSGKTDSAPDFGAVQLERLDHKLQLVADVKLHVPCRLPVCRLLHVDSITSPRKSPLGQRHESKSPSNQRQRSSTQWPQVRSKTTVYEGNVECTVDRGVTAIYQ